MDLLSTHHCFDDALDYLNQRVLAEPHLARWSTLWLVHGIAQNKAGELYAHAWCEEGGRCWDAAIAEGQRVWYAVPRDEFYAARQIQETTRYTVRSACRHNLTSGHYGPWEEKYRALCGRGDRVFDRVAADASGATIRTWEGTE